VRKGIGGKEASEGGRSKLTSQSRVQDSRSSSNEPPAPLAHVLVLTACSDLVVVGHVDIEDELASKRDEGGWTEGLLVSRLEDR